MPTNRRAFSSEFKEEASKIVIDGSRAVADVAREISVNEQTLRNWVAAYRKAHAGEEPPLSIPERARLRELESEVRELRLKSEFLGKSRGLLRPGVSVSSRYEFIDGERATLGESGAPKYTVVKMCGWMEVSKSGFYEWWGRPQSATAARREWLASVVTKAFTDSDGTYGHRRVHAQLARWGENVSVELVRALMRQLGLVACQPRPWRHNLTESGPAGPIPDLVERDFTAAAPGEKMVGDITYIPTWEGWLFLATVIDCHTKKVVGWATDDNYKTPLICAAIAMACSNNDISPKAIFHSDRGSNYTSEEFAVFLARHDMRHSVGRTGICYDNAMAESFFAALKNERVHRTVYPTREQARKDVARYIEFRYNRRRFHSALGYRTPQEVHDEYLGRNPAA
ncbi:MAG: IS3 family transposase [Pseudonocardiaceae bacterium]